MPKSERHVKAAKVRWARHNATKPQSFRLTEEELQKIHHWSEVEGSSGSAALRSMIAYCPTDPPPGTKSQPAASR